MSHPRCAQRALAAMRAAYPGEIGVSDPDQIARDLLTDLRHFCDVRAVDFDRIYRQSKKQYAREAK